MKRKEFLNEIRGLSVEDLRARAQSFAEELMKLRFRNASGQLTQGHRIGEVKRNLARVQGMLSAKAAEARDAARAA
jgi:large subunit ribosomal protein L29